MSEFKFGMATLTVPDHLDPPSEAGTLSTAQILALRNARPGVGLVCADSATAMEQTAGSFTAPPDLTPTLLREVGARAEDADAVIRDLEFLLHRFKQANLIFDGEADRLLGKLNDFVKAQAKHNPELNVAFSSLRAYFQRGR